VFSIAGMAATQGQEQGTLIWRRVAKAVCWCKIILVLILLRNPKNWIKNLWNRDPYSSKEISETKTHFLGVFRIRVRKKNDLYLKDCKDNLSIVKFVVQDINALIMRPIWPKYIKPLVKVTTHPSQYYFGQNGVNFRVLCVKWFPEGINHSKFNNLSFIFNGLKFSKWQKINCFHY
jgi:hypothetical protein